MGKYMREGKSGGKVAVMEVSQGALGVRTRAKTLALVEHDRKLALARSVSSKHQHTGVVDRPFHTSYLELRSRKLEKVLKDIAKPVGGHASREDLSIEDDSNYPIVEGTRAADDVVCIAGPGRDELLCTDIVTSSQAPELSTRHEDGFRIIKDYAMESAFQLSYPRATLHDTQLRSSETAFGEEAFRSGNVPPGRSSEGVKPHASSAVPGGGSLIGDDLSQDCVHNGRPEVESSCEYVAGELGQLAGRRRLSRGGPMSSSSKERGIVTDLDPEAIPGTGFQGDRRMANHHRLMNRRYMRTNLFSDAKAIDELFATPDHTEREEGKRFTERYNYDVVNDKPLNGRYEWAPAEETSGTTTPTVQHLTEKQQIIRS